jgi:hypothetical protein
MTFSSTELIPMVTTPAPLSDKAFTYSIKAKELPPPFAVRKQPAGATSIRFLLTIFKPDRSENRRMSVQLHNSSYMHIVFNAICSLIISCSLLFPVFGLHNHHALFVFRVDFGQFLRSYIMLSCISHGKQLRGRPLSPPRTGQGFQYTRP